MQQEQGYKVYRYRWVVLLMYMLAAATIQLLWATFFSVTTEAGAFYGYTDPVAGEQAISLLSMIFMIGMIIISLPSMAAFEKFGYKKSVGFGAVLTGAAALIRGFWGENYGVVVACTVAFSIAQPFILNAVGLVAGKWFPANERATANGLGVLSNYFGMIVGLLMTPLLLQGGMDIKGMLMLYGVIGGAAGILFIVFTREAPPTAPCAEEESGRASFMEGLRTLFKKRDFILALAAFFISLGIFNTFFTLIEPILSFFSGGKVDSVSIGLIGVIILATGIVGSIVIPVLSDKDKWGRRKPYIMACMVLGTIGLGLFMLVRGFSGMAIAAVLYGLFCVGGSPVVLAFTAEIAYPTSEGTSESLLMFAGNIGGVVFLAFAGAFSGNQVASMAMQVISMAIAVILLSLMREKKANHTNA